MLYLHIKRQKTYMLLQETFPKRCSHSIQQKQKDLSSIIFFLDDHKLLFKKRKIHI
jgi:hypothetical protein